MKRCLPVLLLLLLVSLPFFLFSQSRFPGTIYGKISDAQTGSPVEYANIVLRTLRTDSMVSGTVSDSSGAFRMKNIPYGTYIAEYSFIGYEKRRTGHITLDHKKPKVELGLLSLTPASVTMNEVTVTAEKSMMINKIDRKVFNVQKDISAQTGTVTDLLQTIPSISVDIDGNISLRGSGNVTILINGRPSVMSGAANLDQMPASLIEKIEVITNPSARYKPDGTAGIINIILKKERKAGLNGVAGVNAGNNDRINSNLQLNLNTGKVNIFGSYGFRQDYRHRISNLNSQTIDSAKKSSWLAQTTGGYAKPVSHLVQLGFDWAITRNDAAGVTGIYNYRQVKRHDSTANLYQNDSLKPTEDFMRQHNGLESQNSFGLTAFFEHTFDKEKEHQFMAGFEFQRNNESSDDFYTNFYSVPLLPDAIDHTIAKNSEQKINVTAEYTRPLWKDASLETGYEGNIQLTGQVMDVAHYYPPTGHWITYLGENNDFHASQSVHALFATVSYNWKKLSVMGGLRAEEALVNLEFRTLDTTAQNNYFALYPTIHLRLASGKNEWQLNYSRRVNRPDGEDMNPVAEYRDPRNIFVGNPHLKPEDIHSLEFGYAVRFGKVNLIPTIFYRHKVNGFTFVTRNLNDTVLVSTIDNLAKDQSGGMDLSGTAAIARIITLNFSASGFYSQIDASNIGYSSHRSTFSWNAKIKAAINVTKTTIVQVNGQ
ncbi:MAG: TonB-dependent receptor [Bacteroidota bacterium]